jgi:hypothetical protein
MIVVINTKGGAGKSTVAMQVAASYILSQRGSSTIFELDNENQDSRNFSESSIEAKQVHVDENQKDVNATVRDMFLSSTADVVDVGGNHTTSKFLTALRETQMFSLVGLFIIPISSAFQDLENAKKTMRILLDFHPNANIVFGISRSRHPYSSERVKYQFGNFFADDELRKYQYFILQDSDAVDLSRNLRQTVFEIANDEAQKEAFMQELDKAFAEKDKAKIYEFSILLEIFEDARKFAENDLKQAFAVLAKALKKAEKGAKDE